tara:strand:+ start:485 stop:661 length:177 start_codon:yes stop_codon:yes gene_type:complete
MKNINNDTYDKLEDMVEKLEQEQGRLYDLGQEIMAENDKTEDTIKELRSILNEIQEES